jgi:hypothetical protein
MRVHLFGLPISVHRRLKEASRNWEEAVPAGHEFRATPLPSNSISGFSNSDLNELVSAVGAGFAHVVIPANRDWQEVKKRLEFDCRIHVSRLREPLRDLTWPLVKESLHRLISLDEIWLEKLSPKDLRHALLLPPEFFATHPKTTDFWRRCDVYSLALIADSEQLLLAVEQHHRKPDGIGGRSWVDNRARRFRIDPSRHGRSANDRSQSKSYRFCYEIPAGFHYDVTDENGRPFTVKIGNQNESIMHCNVTPWGMVRRG